MANEMENAVVETTENTEKVGFFKKHGKKILIGVGAAVAAGAAFLIGKHVGSKKSTTSTCDSDDYIYESNDEPVDDI